MQAASTINSAASSSSSTATLLHDDVVDDADIRRGRQTARKVWGNQVSILVGDYLYSKAMCQVVEFRSQKINEVLAEACKKMAEGEVLQLYYNGNPCDAGGRLH